MAGLADILGGIDSAVDSGLKNYQNIANAVKKPAPAPTFTIAGYAPSNSQKVGAGLLVLAVLVVVGVVLFERKRK